MDVSKYLDVRTAPQVLFSAAAAHKDHVRYVLRDAEGNTREVTLGEHAERVREVAAYLVSEGLGPDRVAAIFAPNRVEWMEAALATEAARGVMVPIYASSTAEQAGYILSHSDARFLFVDTEVLLTRVFEAWDALAPDAQVICLDDGIDLASARRNANHGPDFTEIERRVVSWSTVRTVGRDRFRTGELDRRLEEAKLEDRAIMLYTSGTTGNPKGVPLTHANMGENQRDWLRVLAPKLAEGDVDLLWLPMSHVFGYGEACIGNLLGWTSHMCTPPQVIELLPIVRPQTLMSVPSYWEKIALAAKEKSFAEVTGGRLRFCLSGGAGLKREIKERFLEEGVLIIEGYGLTETSPTLTMNRPDDFDFTTVGKPFPSVELRLDEDGEILAKGPNVFGGYHRDPIATKAAFTEDGWFKTGDLGAFTESGFLRIVGRKKEILVTAGGKNVSPANIEVRFNDDPIIEHLVVYGDGKKYLVAGVWVRSDVAWDEARLQATVDAVNENLASCETIKRFRVMERPLTVEDGFLTPTLKLRRKKVYEAFGERLEALYA
ncbi:MAG: AMP-dependent synthetase/ligase [Deltaproteobacteria bacterium]|jgi:long-chain acyl-CoA synthetase